MHAMFEIERARTFGVSAAIHLAIGAVFVLFARERVLHQAVSEPVEFELTAPEIVPPPVVAPPLAPPEPLPVPTTTRPTTVPNKVAVALVDKATPFQPDAPIDPGDREAPEGTEAVLPPTAPLSFDMSETVGSGGLGEGYTNAAVDGNGSLGVAAGGGGSGGSGPVANQGAVGVKVARDWEITQMPEPANDRDFEPTYPPAAKREGREAVVIVQLDIDNTGVVVDAAVVDGPNGHGFRKAALAYAKKLRFKPAQAGTRAVASRIEWTVHFYVRN